MISIIGNGSIGLTLGALFAKAGIPVRIVTRREVDANEIIAEGVISGRFKAEFSTELGDPEAVIVAVKAYSVREASKKIDRDVPVLYIQNGLDILELVKDLVKRPVRALTGIGAYRKSPNRVFVSGINITRIGVTPSGDHKIFEELRKKASLPYKLEDPVRAERIKASLNAGINPVTALLRVKNGELLRRRDALEVALRAVREAKTVAEAYGIDVGDVESMLIRGIERTAENYSSMAMDVMNGRPTEIDYINGKIVEKARAKNLEVPVNETLRRLVRSLSF